MSKETTNAELRDLIKQNAEAIASNAEAIASNADLIKGNTKAISRNTEAIRANGKAIAANAEKLDVVAEQVATNAELITEVQASINALPDVLAVRNSRSFQDHEERIEQLEIEVGFSEPATS